MCHGEEHDYTEYDKRYEEVQKALMSDTKIHYIFKKEEQLAKEKEKQKNSQSAKDYLATALDAAKQLNEDLGERTFDN